MRWVLAVITTLIIIAVSTTLVAVGFIADHIVAVGAALALGGAAVLITRRRTPRPRLPAPPTPTDRPRRALPNSAPPRPALASRRVIALPPHTRPSPRPHGPR